MPGPLDVAGVEIAGIAGPEAVIGGGMEHAPHPLNGRGQRSGIAKVAGDDLNRKVVDGLQAAARPHQHAHPAAAPDQQAREVTSDEAGRAGDERDHYAVKGSTARWLPDSCHLSSFQLSPRRRLAPRTADGS